MTMTSTGARSGCSFSRACSERAVKKFGPDSAAGFATNCPSPVGLLRNVGVHGHVAAGPRNLIQLVVKRARMEGFLVLDYWDRAAEAIGALAKWYQEGRIKYRVHEVDGLKNAPAAMNQLFDGTHHGKLLVKI